MTSHHCFQTDGAHVVLDEEPEKYVLLCSCRIAQRCRSPCHFLRPSAQDSIPCLRRRCGTGSSARQMSGCSGRIAQRSCPGCSACTASPAWRAQATQWDAHPGASAPPLSRMACTAAQVLTLRDRQYMLDDLHVSGWNLPHSAHPAMQGEPPRDALTCSKSCCRVKISKYSWGFEKLYLGVEAVRLAFVPEEVCCKLGHPALAAHLCACIPHKSALGRLGAPICILVFLAWVLRFCLYAAMKDSNDNIGSSIKTFQGWYVFTWLKADLRTNDNVAAQVSVEGGRCHAVRCLPLHRLPRMP